MKRLEKQSFQAANIAEGMHQMLSPTRTLIVACMHLQPTIGGDRLRVLWELNTKGEAPVEALYRP